MLLLFPCLVACSVIAVQQDSCDKSRMMSTYQLKVFKDKPALAQAAVEHVADLIKKTVAEKPRVSLSLSGGSTPKAAYQTLSTMDLPWEKVDMFPGDERWVNENDPSSNAKMIRESLMANSPGSNAVFHPVPCDLPSAEESAEAFGKVVEEICGSPAVIDILLLGLGDDGHTASLFPGTPATTVTDKVATIAIGNSTGVPITRVTLTAPVLSAAKQAIFLVSGAGKAEALKRLMDASEDPVRTPAKRVQTSTPIIILADEAAAGIPSNM